MRLNVIYYFKMKFYLFALLIIAMITFATAEEARVETPAEELEGDEAPAEIAAEGELEPEEMEQIVADDDMEVSTQLFRRKVIVPSKYIPGIYTPGKYYPST
jgi:hypothetical protein